MSYTPRVSGEAVRLIVHSHPGRECTMIKACYRVVPATWVGGGMADRFVDSGRIDEFETLEGERIRFCSSLDGPYSERIRPAEGAFSLDGWGWPYEDAPEHEATLIGCLRRYLRELGALDATLEHYEAAVWPGETARHRARLVEYVCDYAASLGWPTGVELDPATPRFPVVRLAQLPTGQVSWHTAMPAPLYGHSPECGCCTPQPGGVAWDGHTRDQAARRIAAWL